MAHLVVPQNAGEPAKTGIAFEHWSFCGGGMHCTTTVWLHGALVLLQQSTARQVRVAMRGQILLVMVFWTKMVRFVPQQLSWAVGVPKFHGFPGTMVVLPGQLRMGGVVSTTLTSCVQVVLLLQQSVARQTPE